VGSPGSVGTGGGNSADPGAWRSVAPRYGVIKHENVEVRMSDGVRVLADVYRPADLRTGKPAAGTFPVLLAQTPYKKSSALTTQYADNFGEGALGKYGGDG
jgi:predicted acyl esterase